MSKVELFMPAEGYQTKVLLSIRTVRGHLIGVGEVDLTGLHHGAFASIDGVDRDEIEEILFECGEAAVAVIEKRLDKIADIRSRVRARESA